VEKRKGERKEGKGKRKEKDKFYKFVGS